MKQLYIVRFFFLFFGCGSLLVGCIVTGPAGKWQTDLGAQQAFEAGQVFPDHTYYYLVSRAVNRFF